jgi:hypothetical protein
MGKTRGRTETGFHKMNPISIGCAGGRSERWERLNGDGEMRKGLLKLSLLRREEQLMRRLQSKPRSMSEIGMLQHLSSIQTAAVAMKPIAKSGSDAISTTHTSHLGAPRAPATAPRIMPIGASRNNNARNRISESSQGGR